MFNIFSKFIIIIIVVVVTIIIIICVIFLFPCLIGNTWCDCENWPLSSKVFHWVTAKVSHFYLSGYKPALEGRSVINLQMSDTFAAFQDINAAVRVNPTAELLTNRGVIHQVISVKKCFQWFSRSEKKILKIHRTLSDTVSRNLWSSWSLCQSLDLLKHWLCNWSLSQSWVCFQGPYSS